MKRIILYILFVCLFVSGGLASYTYEVYNYDINSKTLYNSESILFDQEGGMLTVNLRDESSADILGTSDLVEGSGGIWEVRLGYTSSFYMIGGQVHEINIGNDATAFLSGGLIQQIWSGQSAWKQEGDPPGPVWNPHITIECLDHFYNTTTNMLTGHWLDDGTSFSIYLIDVENYSPAIENIQFVPEPATLLLLGFGGLLLRRRSHSV
jgi:hypothetical protein